MKVLFLAGFLLMVRVGTAASELPAKVICYVSSTNKNYELVKNIFYFRLNPADVLYSNSGGLFIRGHRFEQEVETVKSEKCHFAYFDENVRINHILSKTCHSTTHKSDPQTICSDFGCIEIPGTEKTVVACPAKSPGGDFINWPKRQWNGFSFKLGLAQTILTCANGSSVEFLQDDSQLRRSMLLHYVGTHGSMPLSASLAHVSHPECVAITVR